MTSVWNRELPLDEAISLIGVLDRRQEELRGGMLPFLPEPEEARAMYANCVIYRDPDDPGHTVRLMPGIPESPVRQARAPTWYMHGTAFIWTAGERLRCPNGIPIFRWSVLREPERNLPRKIHGRAVPGSWVGFWKRWGMRMLRNDGVEQKTGCGMLHGGCNQDV